LASSTTPPPSSPKSDDLTIKQQREQKRAAKVAVLRKQEAAAKRRQRITVIGLSALSAGIIAIVVIFIVTSATPKAAVTIQGLKTWSDLPANHVDGTVDYEKDYGMNPPAGGNHNGVWLNCGIYNQPQPNENAVHVLEHAGVWITYDASKVTGDDLKKLQSETPSTFAVLSPYPDLPAPVVVSAWGAQVQLKGVDDARLKQFITKYWQASSAPELGAACTGGLDGPGKIG
jgi:Protein of unknown function (DUF3105)